MNPEAEKVLKDILEIAPANLTPDQIGFLKARRSYLKPAQLEEYEEVLHLKEPEKKEEHQTSKETVKKTNAK